jgi:hypothetical protein
VENKLFDGILIDDATVAKAEAERERACDMGSTKNYLVCAVTFAC